MVIFPQVLADAKQQNIAWGNDIGITMSGLSFTAVGNAYVPKMLWTGGTNPRSCLIPMLPAADTTAPTPSTLPMDVFGPGSLIVVDVTFSFRPTIAPFFMQTIPISRSYYVAPRYVTSINYAGSAGSTIASSC
jgi:hypothetical protein